MNKEIEKLQEIIDDSENIVFFGGAGVSTESNIPDFRSADGLYQQKYKYSPEQIVSHTFFMRNTEGFYEFYKEKMMFLDAKPNAAHKKLAELEQAGKLKAIITQNIDGLHQAAGSRKVLELHGSVLRNYCEGCGKYYSDKDGTKEIAKSATVTAKLPDEPKSPQTGDNSNLMLWIALLFISGGAVVGTTVVSKKKKHSVR